MISAKYNAPLVDLAAGRLWSLCDVINSSVSSLASLSSQLMLEQMLRENDSRLIDKSEYEHINGWLKIARFVADDFEMKAVHNRIILIERQMKIGITHARLSVEYRALRETLDFELKGHLIYRYPNEITGVILGWKDDWKGATSNFPSAEKDIFAAVDLWALGHATACVFHLMRVLEHGIKVLAEDLGLTFDIQNWQNILNEIESEVRKQSKTLPRGQAKQDRLRFLSEAVKEFHFFKDGWRNYLSHNKAIYDMHQARSVMDHVRSFMNGLSLHLSERHD